jgi:hypothetical protein
MEEARASERDAGFRPERSVIHLALRLTGRNPHRRAWAAKDIRLLAAPAEPAIGRQLVRPCNAPLLELIWKAWRSAGQSLGRNNAVASASAARAPFTSAKSFASLSTSATPARRQQSTLGARQVRRSRRALICQTRQLLPSPWRGRSRGRRDHSSNQIGQAATSSPVPYSPTIAIRLIRPARVPKT